MTLLEQGAPEGVEGRGVLVLETERLVLRPPRFEDAAAIAALGNDRRITENTLRIPYPYHVAITETPLRIPYPYTLADAQAFLAAANASGGAEIVFLITTWVGTVLGCCGMAQLDGAHPEIRYLLRAPFSRV